MLEPTFSENICGWYFLLKSYKLNECNLGLAQKFAYELKEKNASEATNK
jgi:hypothetical protein